MTNLVTFPGLGLSFEVNRVAFTIGGMNIYWYGVLIATGIVLAIRDQLGLPVRYIGLGEHPEDLRPFDIESYLYGICEGMSPHA